MIKIIVNNTVQYCIPEERIELVIKNYEALKANTKTGDFISIKNDLGRELKRYEHWDGMIYEQWTLINNPLLSYERVEGKL